MSHAGIIELGKLYKPQSKFFFSTPASRVMSQSKRQFRRTIHTSTNGRAHVCIYTYSASMLRRSFEKSALRQAIARLNAACDEFDGADCEPARILERTANTAGVYAEDSAGGPAVAKLPGARQIQGN
jgi:hypothetical protein